MRIRTIAATGVAGLAAAAMLTLGAGAANAATTQPCPGTGPAASLSAEDHDAFLKEMTALKAQRDAIMKKYGRTVPAAGKGQRAGHREHVGQGQRAGQRAGHGQRVRGGTSPRLTTSQRTALQSELAKWRVSRDALFTKYGITARGQGHNA